MRIDGLENKEKQLNEWFFDRNPVTKQCLVSYLHLSNHNMLIRNKNYQYSLIFSLKDGIKLPLSVKDRDNYLKSIKKFMQEFLEAEHCVVRGNIYGVDKINIVPCGGHHGQVVFFNEVFRDEKSK